MAGFDPTQVPTSPVEIDWSHPLAEGLQGFWLPGLPPPQDLTGRYPPQGLMTISGATYYPKIGASAIGPAFYSSSPNSPNAYVVNNGPILGGRTEFSILAIAQTTFSTASYGNDIYCERAASGNDIIQMVLAQNGSTGVTPNSIGFTYRDDSGNLILVSGNSSINNGIPHYVGVSCSIDSSTSVLSYSIYIDGILSASGTGTSTTAFTNTGIYSSISGDLQATTAAGYSAAFVGAIPAVGVYDGVLPPSAFALWRSEPFAMLRPIRRRMYFVPASSGASLSVAGRAAPFGASVGLKFGASASIQAASPPFFADVALAPQVQATIAGAVHPFDSSIAQEASASAAIAGASAKPSAAFALAAQVETTIAGIERELSAAIDLNTGNAAFIEVSGALPPFRSSIAEVVSASASVAGSVIPPQGDIAALLSAAMSVASHVYGPSANVRLSAGVTATMDIAAILGPLSSAIAITPAVPSSRIIRAQPVVRETSPLGAAPIAFWSQRAAGDVDTFSVDFSPLLAAGEALTGAPVVTVPTGDLTIADVAETGNVVSLTVSGAGTQGNYSSILIETATTSERTIALTGMVVTGAFLPSLPNPDMGAMLRVSPVFGPRAAGDADIYAVDFSPWLDVGETITGCTVSALTADLAVSQASYAGSIVTWQASGSGAPGAWTAFLAIVQTSAGRTLGSYFGVFTNSG